MSYNTTSPLSEIRPSQEIDLSGVQPHSPRLSQKFWIMGTSTAIILILLVCFFWPTAPKKKVSKTDPSMERFIPEDEVQPQFLASLTKDNSQQKTQASKEEKSSHEPVSTAIQPSGSMTIFVSNEGISTGSLGIPMGVELSAVLEQSIVVGGASMPAVAKISSDFIKGGKNLLPKGARLFGQATGLVEGQLQLRFNRIVFPNGKDFPFSGVSLVEGHLKSKRGSRALSVLAGAGVGSTGVFLPGGAGYIDTFSRNAYQGAVNDVGRDLSYYRNTEATPVITVRGNKKIIVMVDRPL